jgi:hypothetical protein
MFGGYLIELEKQLQKLCQVKEAPARKTAKAAAKTAPKTAKKAPSSDKKVREAVIETFTGLVPSDLQLSCGAMADRSGYVAPVDGFMLVRRVFQDIE